MSNGWAAKQVLSGASPIVIPGSQTNVLVGKEYPITAGGSLNHVVKLVASGVTLITGITAKLQSAIGNDWVDSKTVAITADGNFYIKLQSNASADQTHLPLLNKGRLVITTGAGDLVTISSVEVLQEL
jgi:hypothetical protein